MFRNISQVSVGMEESGQSARESMTMDEDQRGLLAQTLDLLISAGYFRAKIQEGLSNFDKIVGGIVWCISLCAHRVDVDLLYSDNQKIGQKIALTERIVKVLPELSCPFSLEPHQIQGLDLAHIYPVVQWLVNEANFVRQRLGDETLNFAVYQFGQQGWRICKELEQAAGNSGVLPLVKRRPHHKVYRRVMRMQERREAGEGAGGDGSAPTGDEDSSSGGGERLLVMSAGPDDESGVARMVYLEEGESGGGVDQKAEYSGEGVKDDDPATSMEELSAELARLEAEKRQLDEQLEAEAATAVHLSTERDQIGAELCSQDQALNAVPTEMVNKLRALLAQRDEVKASESTFKAQCRQKLTEMDAEIERLELEQQNDGGEVDDDEKEADAERAVRDATQRARAAAAELAALNRAIVRLARRAGARLSQVELAQYQSKFVELCNQMSSKHSETKRQYTLYNTLVSVRDFIQREMNLLNSIDDQRELAQREDYRDSLLANLHQICRGVDESLDKNLGKKRGLVEQRDRLHNQLQLLQDKQRMYTKTVVEFQQECQLNEELRDAIGQKPQ